MSKKSSRCGVVTTPSLDPRQHTSKTGRRWSEKNTGNIVTDIQRRVLDGPDTHGKVAETGVVFDAKYASDSVRLCLRLIARGSRRPAAALLAGVRAEF